jgi:hypothetical protein
MIFWADFLPTSLLYISILLMQDARARHVRRGDCKRLGMVRPSDNEEEDDLVAKVLAVIPGAKEVQDMLLHTDQTDTA